MKTQIAKTALFSLIAGALMIVPSVSFAAAKEKGDAFHGKVTAVDTTASTITVKGKEQDQTISVTSDTKITKDGQPATLADITVGAAVHGAYTKDAAGKMTAKTVAIGGGRGKKKAQ